MGIFGPRNAAKVADDIRKAQIAALRAERDRKKRVRAYHLQLMADEREAARAAIERVKGPQEHFPKAQRRIKP